MKAALYFPNLRGKRGEITALGHLSPLARARIRPLIDLPKPRPQDKLGVESFLLDLASTVARNWGARYPFFGDFSRYGPDEITAVGSHPAEYFFGLTRDLGLNGIPVAGPRSVRGPGDTYLKAVSRVARRDGRGIGLRIPFHDLSRTDTLPLVVDDVITTIGLGPEAIDLFLDVEAIALLPFQERSENAIQAMLADAIQTLGRWRFRTLVLTGSSLPETLGKRHDWTPVRVARTELAIWLQLLVRRDLPLTLFGDYGVVYPFESDVGKPVRPPSRIRFSVEHDHLIYRAKPEEYAALCATALNDVKSNQLPDCWGAALISSCARGRGSLGNATEWVARDTNIHLEATVRLVEHELAQQNRLAGIELETPRVEPWLQQALNAEGGG